MKFISVVMIFLLLAGCASRIETVRTENTHFKPPEVREKPFFEYPVSVQKKGIQGMVGLELNISREGRVEHAYVAHSSGNLILDKNALEYAKRIIFFPAIRDGNPTPAKISFDVKYLLESKKNASVPLPYIEQVNALYEQIQNTQGNDRNTLLQELLNLHQQFASDIDGDSRYNDYIRQIVLDATHDTWKPVWHLFPLRFVVFQDFLNRYAGSTAAGEAGNLLKVQLEKDIHAVRHSINLSEAKKSRLLGMMADHYRHKYPDLFADTVTSPDAS